MLKFLVGVVMIAFTTLCGYFLAKKYRQRRAFFAQFREFNERFLSEINYYRRPIPQFIDAYQYQGEFSELLHALFTNVEGRSVDQGVISDVVDYPFLKAEEKRMIEGYFTMLGKGDSASQKAYFSSVKDTLFKFQTESEASCKKYGDLYIKMGFLAGLLLLILII